MDASSSKYLANARKGTRPLTVDCAGIKSGVSRVDVQEVPSQFTSVIKPNQDCEKNITREDQKSYSDDINLPRESLQKMITINILFYLTNISLYFDIIFDTFVDVT